MDRVQQSSLALSSLIVFTSSTLDLSVHKEISESSFFIKGSLQFTHIHTKEEKDKKKEQVDG